MGVGDGSSGSWRARGDAAQPAPPTPLRCHGAPPHLAPPPRAAPASPLPICPCVAFCEAPGAGFQSLRAAPSAAAVRRLSSRVVLDKNDRAKVCVQEARGSFASKGRFLKDGGAAEATGAPARARDCRQRLEPPPPLTAGPPAGEQRAHACVCVRMCEKQPASTRMCEKQPGEQA